MFTQLGLSASYAIVLEYVLAFRRSVISFPPKKYTHHCFSVHDMRLANQHCPQASRLPASLNLANLQQASEVSFAGALGPLLYSRLGCGCYALASRVS